MQKIFSLILCLLIASTGWAQDAGGPEMADGLRASGKIYVVVLVIATIFVGIIAYLIVLEQKIKKLEKQSQ